LRLVVGVDHRLAWSGVVIHSDLPPDCGWNSLSITVPTRVVGRAVAAAPVIPAAAPVRALRRNRT
jgi:hypothetical protein